MSWPWCRPPLRGGCPERGKKRSRRCFLGGTPDRWGHRDRLRPPTQGFDMVEWGYPCLAGKIGCGWNEGRLAWADAAQSRGYLDAAPNTNDG
jgi:cytochrome c-type biogenesis protein CcmH/NrfF